MGERRGNRFYPHATLSSSGTLNPEISSLVEQVEGGLARGNLNSSELKAALRSCELLFWKGAWSQVEDLASRVIASGCGYRATFRLYRFWMESLRSSYNFDELKTLARHLLSLRHSSQDFASLSVIALSYCGDRRFSGKILRALKSAGASRGVLFVEAVAVYNGESSQRVRREKGIRYFQALNKQNTQNYFLARNYLIYSLENDYLEEASRAFEMIHERFPRCPEPFWGAARLAVAQGQWSEAVRVLQELVADNPEDPDALIALASCLEKTGDLLAARDILVSSKNLFEKNDYEYSLTFGSISKQLFERYQMDQYRDEAVRSIKKAIFAAEKLSLSEASLRLSLNELTGVTGYPVVQRNPQVQELKDSSTATPSPRSWILSVEDHDVENLKKHCNLLMRSPSVVKKGDLVLIARRFGSRDWRTSQQQIVGVMCTLSAATPDCKYGFAVSVGRYQELETPLDFQLGHDTTALLDFFGCENFSAQSPVFYLDADPETSEDVVRAVERSLRRVKNQEALQYVV